MKKRITVQSAKGKGRRLQQWACERISEITGEPWGSSGDDCPIESRPMGQNGTDVRMESHVLRLFPYSVECKHQEVWSVPAYIRQASENMLPNTDWLLLCKKKTLDHVVFIEVEALERIFKDKGYSLEDFVLAEYSQQSWYLDAWIQLLRYNYEEAWLLKLARKGLDPIYAIDAFTFFNLWGQAPIQRTNFPIKRGSKKKK